MPLKPSGQTPTSSPVVSSRSASGLQASVCPDLRASGPSPGVRKTRSAPSIRRCRCAGWWSSSASAVITASSGSVPEWLATTSAPPVDGTCRRPVASTRNHFSYSGRNGGASTCSGEVAVEAEVVDLVVAGDPAAQEGQAAGDPALPVRPVGGPAAGSRRRDGAAAAAGPAGRSPSPCSGITRASPTARPGRARRGRRPDRVEDGALGPPHRGRLHPHRQPAGRTTSSNAATVSYRGV